QQGDLEKLNALLVKYPEHQFHVTHQIYQRQLLHFASDGELTIGALKELEERTFPYFDEQQYYSLVLYYAPVWGDFYEQFHACKQANLCYKRALQASEKVRQCMSS
ncbi:MAG: sugar-phosphatase, partial [Solibacillus sp.]